MLQREVLKKLNNLPDNTNKAISDLNNAKASKDIASTTSNGLMSAENLQKLNTIDTNANYYTHPATHPATMITGLSTVATSGKYTDLDGVPTKVSQFLNDKNYVDKTTYDKTAHTHSNKAILDGITQQDVDNWNTTTWAEIDGKPSTLLYEGNNVSKLTNDANYVNNTQLNEAIQQITGVDGKNLHVHTNLALLETITKANWESKLNVATKSLTTSNWTKDSDNLYSATVTHNLAADIQDVTVRDTDGNKIFVDFVNASNQNSITITTTKAYNAEVEMMYAVTPAAL